MNSENTKVAEEYSSSDDDSEEEVTHVRQTRSVPWQPSARYKLPWCGAESGNQSDSKLWPPDQSDREKWPWQHLRTTKPGNPYYGPRMQLFSSTGWNLALYDKDTVKGSVDDLDTHTYFELSYAGVPGHVRIQCLANLLYLAMNRKGRLYGEHDKSEEGTVFIESLVGSYNTYLSRKYAHLGWYIGLKKSGKIKKGPKTAINQKAVKFLPRRSNVQ